METPAAIDGSNKAGGRNRWLTVGRSDDGDAYAAGAAAAEEAVRGAEPKLLLVFCSASYNLEALLHGINEHSGNAPLIGCSTAGEIATAGPGEAGVVLLALGGDGFSVATATGAVSAGGLREAGASAASCINAIEDSAHRVLLVLSDGLAGDQQEIVRGVYEVAGAGVPLVGGCAGDDLKMQATYQLHGKNVLQGAVVAAALGSDSPLGIGVRHGWRKIGEPLLVTKSSDNRVHTLDNQPALDLYLDRLGAPAEARTDPDAFTRFAMTHPLGVARRTGEDHVRFVAEADMDDRSLGCIAEVPQGGMAWLMEGDDASVLDATDAACRDALATLDGQPPLGMVAFDCIARRGVLGDEGVQVEVDRVARHAAGAPVAGFYTYGEFARTRGISGFHNQTLVVLALG